jgi:hypothetical protein
MGRNAYAVCEDWHHQGHDLEIPHGVSVAGQDGVVVEESESSDASGERELTSGACHGSHDITAGSCSLGSDAKGRSLALANHRAVMLGKG